MGRSSNEYMRLYQRKRYQSRMKEARETLGGKCVKCDSTNQLQLDHIDSITKVMTVSTMTRLSPERFWREVGKCQLLCFDCHVVKSRVDLAVISRRLQPPQHGLRGWRRGCRCEVCENRKSIERIRRNERGREARRQGR